MFHALETECKGYIQDLDDQVKVPLLKSTVSDIRPMLTLSQMNEINRTNQFYIQIIPT